jgi:tetratricopeptide (TPR) repeat protein
MGDHELAWANVQRALDINKRNRTAIRLVVEWGGVDHDFSIAITRLQEYLAIECEDAEMSFTLAKILTHTGRLWEARIEIERVLALDPAIEGAEAVKQILDRELSRA